MKKKPSSANSALLSLETLCSTTYATAFSRDSSVTLKVTIKVRNLKKYLVKTLMFNSS